MAGVVERVGDNRWRLVLPYPRFESLLDVIELASADEVFPMRRKILAAMLFASFMTAPAPAQELRQAIGRDMPELM